MTDLQILSSSPPSCAALWGYLELCDRVRA